MKPKTAPSQIRFHDVKAALHDARFRDTLPPALIPDVQKFLRNPGCACNAPIYRKVLQHCPDQLKLYFPSKAYVPPDEEEPDPQRNRWSVINCHVDELDARIKLLHKIGRKQIAIARHEDQVTVLINDLD